MAAGDTLTPESCAALLAKQRYNPDILPQLEAYIKAQAAKNTYDIDCNLAVLKLYQFHPDLTNVEIISKVLLLALMRLPSTDYISCMYLVPERVQEMELIAPITTLGSLLETCSFRQFWKTLAPQRDELIKDVPGFEQAVRDFVCATMRITCAASPPHPLAHSPKRLRKLAASSCAHAGQPACTTSSPALRACAAIRTSR